jgi:glycosyltransferase involved in cell wall biosynthesis
MIHLLKRLADLVHDANYRRLRRRRAPARAAYQQWVLENEKVTPERVAAFEIRYQRLQSRPLISVIMPVYNANLDWLDQAVESLRRQVYQEWELCIADDCSSRDEVRQALSALPRRDARIKVTFRKENGHISAASNTAIELASGSFLALMDQDDLIPVNALLEMAEAISSHPEAGLLYSDEDKIDELNLRESPTDKGPWDPEKLRVNNYISHLGVYRSDLVRAIGGFRLGFEGAQDHDLALRCTEKLARHQIIYVPKILYHWRIHANSTAASRRAKPYALQARDRCLAEHQRRLQENVLNDAS